MRLGADASYLRWRRTGVARYIDGLLHALVPLLGHGDEMRVYYKNRPGPRLFGDGVVERSVPAPLRTVWYQARLPAAVVADRCDVFLGQLVAPVLLRRSVLVVYDCLPFRDPAAKPGWDGRYLRTWMRAAARRAGALVAISGFAADEARRHLGAADHDITVATPGVDRGFAPADATTRSRTRAHLAAAGATASRLVLQVGAYESHKGGDVAATAVREMRRVGVDVSLVRCGTGERGASAREDGVVDLGYVDEDLLRALYGSVDLVCMPSSHEGFGLPVLEAMASGTPVVAARAGGLVEAGGDAVMYVDPGDVRALACSMQRVLEDGETASRMREAGLREAGRHTWEATATAVLPVLRRVATEARR